MENKKILIISNCCFEKENSNGRTIMELLGCVNKNNLAQFYIHGNPDFTFCEKYYRVSDSDAFKMFLNKSNGEVFNIKKNQKLDNDTKRKIKKTIIKSFFRNIVWKSMLWWNKYFSIFLDVFNPNVVILQAGDSPFMYKVARTIAKRYNCKLVIFNTESYVLKKKLYYGVNEKSIFYKLYFNDLKKEYAKTMKKVNFCIYNIEALEKAYQNKYPHLGKSATLYAASNLSKVEKCNNCNYYISYCGNFGVGRFGVLLHIAKLLSSIDNRLILRLYGKLNQKQIDVISQFDNIKYYGFVDYKDIPKIMSESWMILHCERTDRLENLRYAFSTKIADCLACGVPFLIYASKNYHFVEYLQQNNVAHIASNDEEFVEIITKALKDNVFLNKFVNNAILLAHKNHNMLTNSKKFSDILENI